MPRRIPGLLIAVNVAISVSRAADLADATALLGLVRIASEVGMLQGEVGKGSGLAPALPGPRVNPRSLYRKSPQIRFAALAVACRLIEGEGRLVTAASWRMLTACQVWRLAQPCLRGRCDDRKGSARAACWHSRCRQDGRRLCRDGEPGPQRAARRRRGNEASHRGGGPAALLVPPPASAGAAAGAQPPTSRSWLGDPDAESPL